MGEKNYIWNPATCSFKNGKYVGSFIDNSVMTCDEIVEETKTVPIKTATTDNTSTNFYILLAFFNYHSIIDSC